MRRVVVTGMGIVSALGSGVDSVWSRLLAGASGIRAVEGFSTDDLACKIGGEVFLRDFSEDLLEDDSGAASVKYYSDSSGLTTRDIRRLDKFIQYGVLASGAAIADSGYELSSDEQSYRTGVILGSGMGGVRTVATAQRVLQESGSRRVSPFSVPYSMINSLSGEVALRHGYRGCNHAVVSACATGSHALGEGGRLIMCDSADVMIVGGSEATVTELSFSAFCASRAMSVGFNAAPHCASRPWDRARDGFVMGEGAGVLVLEEYSHARKRGARVYAELCGYGSTCDAYHITAPDPSARSSYMSMLHAFKQSGFSVEDVGYGNAHSTSTPLGDDIELRMIERLYGGCANGLSISSTKSSLGHSLGATGAIEAILAICALRAGDMPPTLNLEEPSLESSIDRLALRGKSKDLRAVFSNSFGFGGSNVCLVFGKC